MLKENLENVEQKIQAACERSGRDRSEVTLIAVNMVLKQNVHKNFRKC